ncbi:hypothetical protein BJ875DRAFT_458753 [Amylocarpus encephaloides]|uniref:Uncharacterized protein n=1 Tax=Amylocarpus encephaloides TaxID=45428 RepID=A0A9P7YKU4_9HELO|nr:hypothetical protein BJ875DRAFT_458753 [Amylocarpus encephaloides]
MFNWINSANIYSRDPIVHQANGTSGLEFTKYATSTKDDPYVVVRQLDYLQGRLPQSWPSWREVVDESHRENGTLLSGVYSGTEFPNLMFSVDACISKEYFESVHSKSTEYLQNEKISQGLVNSTEYSFLKMEGGFLSR